MLSIERFYPSTSLSYSSDSLVSVNFHRRLTQKVWNIYQRSDVDQFKVWNIINGRGKIKGKLGDSLSKLIS